MDGQATIKVVFGQRGSGKSTKALSLVREQPRVLIFDTLGHDYSDGVVFYSLAELRAFWRTVYRGRFRLIYRPGDDPQGEFIEVCKLVYACGRLTFLVEEVDLFFRVGRCDPAFTTIITRGRHAHVELIAVTQAPMGFGALLRSQAHEWFIFSTREPAHVEYFKHRCPGVPVEWFGGLPKWHYVHYTDGADTYEVCIDNPQTGGTSCKTYNLEFATSLPAPGADAVHRGPLGRVDSDDSSPV